MVTLLRASGGKEAELAPQPTLADLQQLITNSGIETILTGELPAAISCAVPVGRVHGSAPDNAVTPPASRNIHGCARCVLQFSRATRHLCRARDRWAGIFRMPKVRRVLGALCKK
ncbi:hypothetical protein GCM10010308_00440 [Streptomyces vinaceusdrappus]|nr:hypothetical protein GCM10010308_00440 [Streptomyces vinaceusdrappus]